MASHISAPNALISSYIDDALDMLNSDDILDYFQDKDLDDNLLEKLSDSLSSINLVMDDAENKHLSNTHKQVSRWLHKVRDAVHDVDDILDEIQTEASQSKLLPVAEFQTTTSSFDEEVQTRLKKVLTNLESLASKKDSLGLEKIKSSGAKSVSQRLETSLVDETAICGRDDDKKAVIDLLLYNNDNGTNGNNLTVISIVGMGGMGKTTLARLIYNDKGMADDEEFQLKAWVCVSQDFDVTKMTRSILEELKSHTSGREELNTLQAMLKEKLAGKKYLLVLDDVWEEKNKKWEDLQAPLIYGARGSKILVTTRSEKVASVMRCAHVYALKKLSEEQSWLLFAKHALFPANSTSDFEEIGKKIIKKCDGLPLALKAIGSLLYNYSSKNEWNTILTSNMWDIPDTGYDIIPALILSYQFLPSVLKRFFAYCSLIPKDYEFDKDWLVELWMAENSLQVHQPNNMGMKELGDRFFDDLLSRSFFQRSTRENELFVMHDLVNDLATYVSKEFCLRSEEEEQAKNITKMTRHFSNFKVSMQFEATCKANKLRTLLSSSHNFHCNKVDDLLCKCKCLRALSLSIRYHLHYPMGHLKYLPDSISNLKHLRYLDLSYWDGLRKLPDSICLLYNLQTLKLSCCFQLKELPSNINKLVNLRHLDIEGTQFRKLPAGIGNLKKLEVLSSFYVGECGEVNINQLGELSRLRAELSIEKLQNVTNPKDAGDADLKNKIHLKKLRLIWDSSSEEGKRHGYEIEEDVLEKLQPPANLKELYIEYYDGKKFPDWLGDMSINNIVSLRLTVCKYCVSLPPLGMLPFLKELEIMGLEGIKSIGAEFYGNNSSSSSSTLAALAPFRSLQSLRFEHMEGWEEWDCENASPSSPSSGAFPCLKKLVLSNCPVLKTKLPQHLPSLLDLAINKCPQLAAAYKKKGLQLYSCLQSLWIQCWEIQILQQGHPFFNSLQYLELRYTIYTDEAFPLYLFPNLHKLRLKCCTNLERLDVGVTSYHHLTLLKIVSCPELVSIPPFNLFPSLTELKLEDCPEVVWPEPEEEEEEEEAEAEGGGGGGGFPSTLKTLHISSCVKLLASHNKWHLHTLTSLTHLIIQDEHFNNMDCEGWLSLPPNLRSLNRKDVGTCS